MTEPQNRIILTGIKPTGTPHIGNYLGAIEPALRRADEYSEAFFFIADYHALNSVQDGETMKELTRNVAATWLAAGLDPSKIHFYRQSDVPEIFELETILNNFVPKGWMNKMHGYKAAIDKNRAAGKLDDFEVNMGLYNYPILMTSDIIIFNATHVPVGRDQTQHVEIARDIAQRFNNQFNDAVFILPEHVIADGIAELPGLDGRKMSKSYNNTIPLYAGREVWEQAVRKIVTDSIEHTHETIRETVLFKLYSTLVTEDQANDMATQLVEKTIGWKQAKDLLLEAVESRFSDQARKYNELLQNPDHIDTALAEGAAKVRPIAQAQLAHVKQVLGI
ncbi:MAG: tryptophanyl-tRNA synthetase [Candidatus Saccharibacteria bacterium]|nr:tryptophanyl-tRNA synthetase [Candidatus Saccharibacteria bacterium]